MKLSIVLVVVISSSAFVLNNVTAQKPNRPVNPSPRPTPTGTPKPAATSPPRAITTPTPATAPTTTPTGAPTKPPTPTPTAAPASTPVAAPTVAAAHAACEDKVQPSGLPLCSRVQPKMVLLGKDAVLDREYKKAVPPTKPVEAESFTHEAHATLNYSVDGTKVIGCAECHHTDQPKAALTGVLKTSERDTILTTAALAVPGARAVFSCRACHAQVTTTPAVCADPTTRMQFAFCPNIPRVTYEEEESEVVLTNTEAYHLNCTNCHTEAIRARKKTGAPPFLKGAPPTSCAGCHKGS